MTTRLPAVSLAAVPGRRKTTIELAAKIEDSGFSGIYCPSLGDGLSLCEAVAYATNEIPFGTSITPIYTRHPNDFAQTAAFIHEISDGRFRFGIGVSHAPAMDRLGVKQGKPLTDMREFVETVRSTRRVGDDTLYIYGGILIVARILHALGLKADKGATPGRFVGTLATFVVIVGVSGQMLWGAIQAL